MTAPRAAAGRLPRAPGVYRFRDSRGAVLYAGRARGLGPADPAEADAYGWADGILVRLGVRAGRLCQWQQTRRRRPDALLAATPPEWRPFADRAAGTAAALVRSG